MQIQGKALRLKIYCEWKAEKDQRKRQATPVWQLTEFVKGSTQEAHLGWLQDEVDTLHDEWQVPKNYIG